MNFLARAKSALSYLLWGTPLLGDELIGRLESIEKDLSHVSSLVETEVLSQKEKESDETVVEQAVTEQTAPIGFKEIVSTVVSFSALVTAIVYFTGRDFASGYFQEMGIPIYQLKFSVWEYGEVGWIYVTSNIVGILIYIVLGLIISVVLIPVINTAWTYISRWLAKKSVYKNGNRLSQLPGLVKSLLINIFEGIRICLLIIGVIVIIICVVIFSSQQAREMGAQVGQDTMLNAYQLTLVTSEPLDIPGGLVIRKSSDQVVYRYEDLYLLTFNDDRYFAYQDFETDVCRPQEVFIIRSDRVVEAILSKRPDSAPTCK